MPKPPIKDYYCTAALRNTIETNLSNFSRIHLEAGTLRRAAVAITLIDYRGAGGLHSLEPASDKSAALIITRRAGGLKNHAGQWALPGGSIDPGESPEKTAFRELEEEVGLQLPEDRLLGYLDDFVTRSGFHITPVVIWGGEVPELYRNEREVASIHRIPIKEFLREDAPMLQDGGSNTQPVLFMPVGNTCIATPTAAMIYQFREVALRGQWTRVAHYKQPYFAWS